MRAKQDDIRAKGQTVPLAGSGNSCKVEHDKKTTNSWRVLRAMKGFVIIETMSPM
jgi:hypothetical protein